MGSRGISRQVVVFEKLLLILKKKDVKKYTYKGHVMVSQSSVRTAVIFHILINFNPFTAELSENLQKDKMYLRSNQ